MVIDKIRKTSDKGVKLKSESYFSISPGVLELWRKNLWGADSDPGTDRVKQFVKDIYSELPVVSKTTESRNVGSYLNLQIDISNCDLVCSIF